jgi:hypothetical protein
MDFADLTTTAAPTAIATDAVEGVNRLAVYAGEAGQTPAVIVTAAEPDADGSMEDVEATFLTLTPAAARAWAAGILNAADEADGTTPLAFVPPSPDGVEP